MRFQWSADSVISLTFAFFLEAASVIVVAVVVVVVVVAVVVDVGVDDAHFDSIVVSDELGVFVVGLVSVVFVLVEDVDLATLGSGSLA